MMGGISATGLSDNFKNITGGLGWLTLQLPVSWDVSGHVNEQNLTAGNGSVPITARRLMASRLTGLPRAAEPHTREMYAVTSDAILRYVSDVLPSGQLRRRSAAEIMGTDQSWRRHLLQSTTPTAQDSFANLQSQTPGAYLVQNSQTLTDLSAKVAQVKSSVSQR